jgi:hypothetical protein
MRRSRRHQQQRRASRTPSRPETCATNSITEFAATMNPAETMNAAAVHPDDPPYQSRSRPERTNLKADVNIASRDVALDQTLFDTFDGGSVTLEDATDVQIRRLLNAIPPIDDPVHIRIRRVIARARRPNTWFRGRRWDGMAHPHRMLNFHGFIASSTGSLWNAAGRANSGPNTGEQLDALPSRSALWFA